MTSEAGPSAEVLRAVHSIMQEKASCSPAAVETTSLADDLALKFKVMRQLRTGLERARVCACLGTLISERVPSDLSSRLGCAHCLCYVNPSPPKRVQVLSACERHFQIAIPHSALVDLVDARTIAAHVEGALRAIQAADAQAAQHWSKTLPSNVNVIGFTGKHEKRNEELSELLIMPVGGNKVWNPARG